MIESSIGCTRARRLAASFAVIFGLTMASGCEDEQQGPLMNVDAAADAASVSPDAATAGGDTAADQATGADATGAPQDALVDQTRSADVTAPDTAPAAPPVYAVYSVVFGPNYEATSYLNVVDSLDVKKLDHKQAREFSGRGSMAAYNGWIFVGSGDAPTITRFSVREDGTLKEDGKVSFANFGLESAGVDAWANVFISPTKAYQFDYASGSHIIWNPTKLEIAGEIKAPELVRKDLSIDGSPSVVRGNRLFRVVYWKNWKEYVSSKEQVLAVYDVENDKLLKLVPEEKCPALTQNVQRDEQGNLYFSNWVWSVGETIVRGAAKHCVQRLNADAEAFDPTFSLVYAGMTGGREGALFNYLKGGKGLIDVFHHERAMYDAKSNPQEVVSTPNWRLWHVDLASRTAKIVEEIPWNDGGSVLIKVDGRDLVPIASEGWRRTTLYEVTPDGKAKLLFDTPGWTYQLARVR